MDMDIDAIHLASITTESTFRDARVFDALLADQGRSDRYSSRETPNRTRRITFRPSRVGSRRRGHLRCDRQSGVLEAKDTVRVTLCFMTMSNDHPSPFFFCKKIHQADGAAVTR